ncbi:MAG: exodeoxyribonuclease I, partial [Aquabacterium sp.]
MPPSRSGRPAAAETPLTFYWHDYETFGRDVRRSRPAQFAGVRTDAELNEIEPPLLQYCQPPLDDLPDPEACLLTGITPQRCREQGLAERDFADTVLAPLSRPGTVGVGYNSIRFDDEVTRHLLWRNLHDPYAREWRDQCGRWDLLDVVRCTWALRPDGITWPTGDDGRVSFKLERLAQAKGLVHEAAHDALSDVRATIALARLVRERKQRLWDFCLKLRRKDAVAAEIGGGGKPLLHLSGRYPVERGCMAIVWPLAPHPVNRNELIVWDLSQPVSDLDGLDAAAIRERMFVRADALPPGAVRLPIKTIHLNRSPVVIGNLQTLTPDVRQRFGIDVDQALRHAEAAEARLPAVDWAAVFQRPAVGPVDVDEDLYGGFVGDGDRRLLDRLRGLAPAELARQA